MVHIKDGLHRPVGPVSVFQKILVFLLLTHVCGGGSQEMAPPLTVMAMVGDDVVLPCQLEPPVDAVSMTMEWDRPDLEPRFVHVWHDGQELLTDQNEAYKGRASLSINKLKRGDISLRLSTVKISDSGRYRCYIPKLSKDYFVELLVGGSQEMAPPLTVVAMVGDDVVLPCQLEPLSCCDFIMVVTWSSGGLVVVGVSLLLAVVYKYKRERDELKSKNTQLQNELLKSEDDMAQMVTTRDHLTTQLEKLQREKDDQVNMAQMVTTLEQQKRELEETRDQLTAQLKKLQTEKKNDQVKMTQMVTTLQQQKRGLEETRDQLTAQLKKLQTEKKNDQVKMTQMVTTRDHLTTQLEKLQREKKNDQVKMTQMVTTLQQQKTGLEETRDQLTAQLEKLQTEKEENKKQLQSVESEITEREKMFDKPERLLTEKENLLKAQWKIDETKRNDERLKMKIENLLEPLEFQITAAINKRRDETN